jgi:homogentisate phytyltransferase/homogentisate geranylgeranyltransferase
MILVALAQLPKWDSVLLLLAQSLALGLFWFLSNRVDPFQQRSIARFYMVLWGLFYAQYLVLSLYQVARGGVG